jgi:hypothetical protein
LLRTVREYATMVHHLKRSEVRTGRYRPVLVSEWRQGPLQHGIVPLPLSLGNMPTCGHMPPQLRAAYPSNTINGERKSARAGHAVLGKEKEKENDIK